MHQEYDRTIFSHNTGVSIGHCAQLRSCNFALPLTDTGMSDGYVPSLLEEKDCDREELIDEKQHYKV